MAAGRELNGAGLCRIQSSRQGREGSAWYADNWPGLLLKREVKGENYKSVTEIIKFDE